MSEKTALLVIEMQNDMLWDKRREKFTYDTAALTAAVNQAIAEYRAAGSDIIYIAQIYPDTPSNHIIFGFQIAGTEGAKLWSGLDVVSELYFEKNYSDVFMAEEFRAFMTAQGYRKIVLCGLDECACIAATAKSAAQSGAETCILTAASATRFDAGKRAKTRMELTRLGIRML